MKLSRLTHIDKNELIQEKKKKKTLIIECNKIIGDKAYRDVILIAQVKVKRQIW